MNSDRSDWTGAHTCHAECRCHGGGTPAPDFEGDTLPNSERSYEQLPESVRREMQRRFQDVRGIGIPGATIEGAVAAIVEPLLDHQRGAVDPGRPHCPRCGREDIASDRPCPTPACLTSPWEAYALLDHPRGAVDPESLARRFHEAYERLAPEFGYETRRESAVPWEDVPEQNKALMVAVCGELLRGAVSAPKLSERDSKAMLPTVDSLTDTDDGLRDCNCQLRPGRCNCGIRADEGDVSRDLDERTRTVAKRITYTVDRIPDGHALWRPRSRAAAIEKAREASLRHDGRFAATAFHPVEAGPLSYRHGETIAVFENGERFGKEAGDRAT